MISTSSLSKNNIIEALKFGFSLITETDNRNYLYLSNREKYSPFVEKNFHFEIIYSSTFENEEVEVDYYYDLDWNNNKQIDFINEYVKYKPISSQRQTTLYERHHDKLKYKPSRQRPCEYEVILSDKLLMANNILSHKDLYYDEMINELLNIDYLYVGSNQSYFINSKNKYLNDGTTFGSSIDDLAKNLFIIYNNYGELYDYIYYYLNKVFPRIEAIRCLRHVRSTKGLEPIYSALIKFKGLDGFVSVDDVTYEIRKILNLLVLSTVAKIKNTGLILFDEVENSINPMVVVDCVEYTKKILKDISTIFTTYSPVLLDAINIENIYIAVDENGQVVKYKTIKPTYYKRIFERCNKLDMPLGYYLFSSIINEEVFEEEILKNALV